MLVRYVEYSPAAQSRAMARCLYSSGDLFGVWITFLL